LQCVAIIIEAMSYNKWFGILCAPRVKSFQVFLLYPDAGCRKSCLTKRDRETVVGLKS
jgi:hypothetical protein